MDFDSPPRRSYKRSFDQASSGDRQGLLNRFDDDNLTAGRYSSRRNTGDNHNETWNQRGGNDGYQRRERPQGPRDTNDKGQNDDRQRRRLYVGNVPLGVPSDVLIEFVNNIVLTQRRNHPGTVKEVLKRDFDHSQTVFVTGCTINKDRNFAFIECSDAESASEIIAFDGVNYGGNSLRIKRPKEYQGPQDECIGAFVKGGSNGNDGRRRDGQETDRRMITLVINGETMKLSTIVPDSENKLYVGGFSNFLDEEQVVELLSRFGKLKSLNMIKDRSCHPPRSKGYAFCEYEDPESTDLACKGLTGSEIGGKKLIVQRASSSGRDGGNQRNMQPNSSTTSSRRTSLDPSVSSRDRGDYSSTNSLNVDSNASNISGPDVWDAKLQEIEKAEGIEFTEERRRDEIERIYPRTMILLNMVSIKDLTNDRVYNEILEDISDEVSKYGEVVNIDIPRPIPGANPYTKENTDRGLGQVRVEFKSSNECKEAVAYFGGRLFNERLVISGFYFDN